MERVGRTARATGGGATQHQAQHPPRTPERQFLGHHATEGNADDMGAVPTGGIHDRFCVLRVLHHGVCNVRLVGEAGATLVEGEHIEAVRQGAVEDVRLAAQVAAYATEKQDRATFPLALVVDAYVCGAGIRHISYRLWSGAVAQRSVHLCAGARFDRRR